MRKGKTVIGKDVLSLAEGMRLHSVKDLIIGADNDEIVALLVDEGGLLSSSTVVPMEAVHHFGKDAVVIADASAVVAASSYPRVKAILDRKESLLGKRVFTSTGEQLGSVADMYFDESTGRIAGLEVSGGALGDLKSGTSYLAIEEIQRSGPDVVFVDPTAAEALDAQVGGVAGALGDAKERVGQAASDAKSSVDQRVSDAKAGAQQDPGEAIIGRRSGMDVMDENGSVVIANGQRVTREHVDRARESGNLEVLQQAVSAGETQETGARVGADLEKLGDSASSLWDRFTSKLSEVTDAQGQRVDEQQTKAKLGDIADAIGRPVTKVILDREDNVVLDLGDIITHQAVQQAYDAGMLDSLLDSVYKGGDVTFTRDEMKAREEGTAVVQKAAGGATLVEELEQKVQTADQEKQAKDQEKRDQAEAEQTRREQERAERAQSREQAEEQRQQELQELQAAAQPQNGPKGDESKPKDAEESSGETAVTGSTGRRS